MLLGVNIDHVATLRNARGTLYPSPLEAALVAQTAGADFITMHLREDRRHIKDEDVLAVRKHLHTRLNLEMALTEEMLEHALTVHPEEVCIVPERRLELTTEGGLDLVQHFQRVEHFVSTLTQADIRVSLFVDPDAQQIEAASALGASILELHTGAYAEAQHLSLVQKELQRIEKAAYLASELGISVHAGHGLNYHNVVPIAKIPPIVELNIGHSLISQALFTGLAQAVRDMKKLLYQARSFP
ncbi:MAG: pyridoxine 5'-phosphate synthase [Neisseriaceae bacterium]